MSRAVRRELLSILETLQKANLQLKKLFVEGRREELTNLLMDCQNSAIAIGSRIEAVYSEGMSCINGLEDYCESLYQMAENIGIRDNWQRSYEESTNLLITIKNRMEGEIPDRLEVVFLPYQVSMWDSLESIWMAAEEDEECDAYVIPIPCYDKNPDGSLGKFSYEGDRYPEYVPVTKYDAYDFGIRRPDVIYVHNPYDGSNFVTSVSPFFYAKNLKKYTDNLIYVPYFILNGKGMDENFVLLPGVLYSDYVIVQNEQEKEEYITILMRNIPSLSRVGLENKILPLGSPKFDKVQGLNRENVNAPREWVEKCREKKVILYNTGISALINENEKYLRKMEDVFNFFQQSEDAVLLWRPHPLLESTLASMRAGLYEEYQKLKKRFLVEEIGIYDDSPDMYTAIGFSDAYYGDRSSVVWLYQQTGKPVMIQDVNILGNTNDK